MPFAELRLSCRLGLTLWQYAAAAGGASCGSGGDGGHWPPLCDADNDDDDDNVGGRRTHCGAFLIGEIADREKQKGTE